MRTMVKVGIEEYVEDGESNNRENVTLVDDSNETSDITVDGTISHVTTS